MKHLAGHHHRRADEGRDRIEFGPENAWNLQDKDIAYHASADSRQHAEQGRRNWASMKGQSLAGSGNGEESQPSSVEHQHGAAQSIYDTEPVERNQSSEDRNTDVSPICECCGRKSADHYISGDPS